MQGVTSHVRGETSAALIEDTIGVVFDRAVETWPDYATYQTKTDRQIPVFVLEPVTSA